MFISGHGTSLAKDQPEFLDYFDLKETGKASEQSNDATGAPESPTGQIEQSQPDINSPAAQAMLKQLQANIDDLEKVKEQMISRFEKFQHVTGIITSMQETSDTQQLMSLTTNLAEVMDHLAKWEDYNSSSKILGKVICNMRGKQISQSSLSSQPKNDDIQIPS